MVGRNAFDQKYQLPPAKAQMLEDMMEYSRASKSRSFFEEWFNIVKEESSRLEAWVGEKVSESEEFKAFHFSTEDTTLLQSVISIDDLYRAFTLFKEDPSRNGNDPVFREAVLRSFALLELGVSIIHIEEE